MKQDNYFEWPSTDISNDPLTSWLELELWELEGMVSRSHVNPYEQGTVAHDAWVYGREWIDEDLIACVRTWNPQGMLTLMSMGV